jgi:riboflavin kinase/FMN adenylyltransferase
VIIVQDALDALDLPHGTVVTIGNYDGIHLGQRAVLERVVVRGRELELPSAVVTFAPHPLSVVRGEGPPLLTTRGQKEALLAETEIDYLLWIRFTQDFSRTPAKEFVRDFLHGTLGVREIHVGSGFVFGHQRAGDLALLQELGSELGFEAHAVAEVRRGGSPVSSSRIRELLRHGEVGEVSELLGRVYAIDGRIVRGDRMGKRLGWPTINLESDNALLPADGVYVSEVFFPSFPGTFGAVTNIGTRPTVYENYGRVVESHILDFSSDVYGEVAELRFFKRLREEQIFQSMMDLSAQIGRDVESAREYFRGQARLDEMTRRQGAPESAADAGAPASTPVQES